tara:strand:- start:1129 stop:1491 length:363 start_codon:yes stop_codon:yes gene_type:complete
MFIEQTQNLIEILIDILPNNYNVKLFKEGFETLRKYNNNLIINSYIKYVLPHKKHIVEHNDIFFLEGGGQEELVNKDNYQFAIDIKDDWKNISIEDKEILWKCFNILVLLSEKIIIESVS